MSAVKLGQKVDGLRKGRNNVELAREARCAPETIRKIIREDTQPNFALGVRIANALNVPASWLGDDAQDWPPPPSEEQNGLEVVRQAMASAGLAGELSGDERRLLAAYRSAPADVRALLLERITGYAEGLILGAVRARGSIPLAAVAGGGESAEARKRRLLDEQLEAELQADLAAHGDDAGRPGARATEGRQKVTRRPQRPA